MEDSLKDEEIYNNLEDLIEYVCGLRMRTLLVVLIEQDYFIQTVVATYNPGSPGGLQTPRCVGKSSLFLSEKINE